MKTTITNEADESSETQQMAMVVHSSNRVSIEVSDDSPAANEPLTDEEDALFTKCKTTIKANSMGFMATGEALATIRNQRLYRQTHKTFEDFCQSQFDFTRSYANRLIQSSTAMQTLAPIGAKLVNEAQVRELIKVPEKQREKVLELATKNAGNNELTASGIKEAVIVICPDAVKPKAAKKSPAPESDDENKVIVMPTVQSSEFDELLRWVRTAIQYLRQPDLETLDAVAWLSKIEDKLESLVAGESERRAG